MNQTFLIFGYGSLVFSPERPDDVVGFAPARLSGFRRAFNKVSHSRACPPAEAFDAFANVPARYRGDGLNRSLALGTVADERAFIDGLVVEYPQRARDEVLRLTDRREDFCAGREALLNGYLREELELRLEAGVRAGLVYLSNPDPRGRWFVPEDEPLEVRAKVLVNATPRTPKEGDARGLLYLEGVRRRLSEAGIVDPELEALAAAVLALDGPWTAMVTPPRRVVHVAG